LKNLVSAFFLLLFAFALSAQTPDTAVTVDTLLTEGKLIVSDVPDDGGGAISISWELADDQLASLMDIYRTDNGEVKLVASDIPAITNEYTDANSETTKDNVKDNTEYYYYAVIKTDNAVYKTAEAGPVQAKSSWFNMSRFKVLVWLVVISIVFLLYLQLARSGKKFYIRKISGLDAVEEAVGRSTEMGKPIMYVLGIGYVTDIPTIAGLTILGRVAKKVAEYETRILVPSYDPVVMTTAQEVVKEAFNEAGRPDLYAKNDIMYITQDQFGYAAGVDGMMLREKPGAIFLQGLFFAESLILAETGHSIGAIQIAGTTETAQLPFFVAACDYTLIGEEMLAASVYMQPDPLMLGSLVAEDVIKLAMIIILIAGLILGILGPLAKGGFLMTMFNFVQNII